MIITIIRVVIHYCVYIVVTASAAAWRCAKKRRQRQQQREQARAFQWLMANCSGLGFSSRYKTMFSEQLPVAVRCCRGACAPGFDQQNNVFRLYVGKTKNPVAAAAAAVASQGCVEKTLAGSHARTRQRRRRRPGDNNDTNATAIGAARDRPPPNATFPRNNARPPCAGETSRTTAATAAGRRLL